jgi:hypothetical protein
MQIYLKQLLKDQTRELENDPGAQQRWDAEFIVPDGMSKRRTWGVLW